MRDNPFGAGQVLTRRCPIELGNPLVQNGWGSVAVELRAG